MANIESASSTVKFDSNSLENPLGITVRLSNPVDAICLWML
ncbi:hypothetical protein L21SP2_1059 [Salinispira pacifica]|uniref:Uncharacterized protein n=1 Tax=Salinispira pacifica TaxID=1307761 RepID=V5WFR6_9SPIO|nr:hypothetical protein L21SP2_1059 [Salinispira pacifica]